MAGSVLKRTLINRGFDVVGVARSNADISSDLSDENQIKNLILSERYDALINAAAQVDISRCDTNPLESWKINAKLVSYLANYSNDLNIPLLQISTDHYYTYGDDYPHKENDQILCINEYSRHKFAAEHFALTSKNSLVIRTSFLGSRKGQQKGLVEWAINKLNQGEQIEVFSDAWTSSLDVETFADVALKLLFDVQYRGVVNVGSSDVYSKEKLIRTLAELLQIDHSKCLSTSIKNIFANRPNCLGLDVSKVEKYLGYKMPNFKEVCEALVVNLNFKKLFLH